MNEPHHHEPEHHEPEHHAQHGPSQSHSHAHGPVQLDEDQWRAWAEHTELEGEVLMGFVAEAISWMTEIRRPAGTPVARVLDIGSGPGVGTCELARAFPLSAVTAVDGSPAMLERAKARARRLGFEDRISTLVAELPAGVEGIHGVDVIWASMSLHHMGDQVASLQALRDCLAPDGLIAIAEFGDPMRMVPFELGMGRPGLGARLVAAGTAWFERMRQGLANSVAILDVPNALESAGFEVVGVRHPILDLPAPLDERERRFVCANLRRAAHQFEEHLDSEDVSTLRILGDPVDPRSAMHREDVFVTASQTLVIGRPKRHI